MERNYSKKYNHLQIEKKWRKSWAKNNFQLWQAKNPPSRQEKMYILDMFPYPSGEGLHVGHFEGYTATDILSRYWKMRGKNVLHPMGWDAFGLPAENYSRQTKKPPQDIVAKNIKRFKQQLQTAGFSYDWTREINTTDPKYYKWTQWIFLQLFKQGLAYEAEAVVNWCPKCEIVLADEEVNNENRCVRCGETVTRKKLKQWFLRITAYADRLLEDLDLVNWPENVKAMQRNWIGRKEGVEVNFKVEGSDDYIKIFTTRLDTIFGASYLVLAPEHPIIFKITTPPYAPEVRKYVEQSLTQPESFRTKLDREKTGVFTGAYAINPANKERIPIWVADYVLSDYGTAAVMGVPAHDERDFEFAKIHHLGLKPVIVLDSKIKELEGLHQPITEPGFLINSGPFNGRRSQEVIDSICLYVGGKKAVHYKLRDWVFSRQRYWGEPIPIIKCEKCGNVPLKESQLPLKLPKITKYQISGAIESPLALIEDWVNVKCPNCGGAAKRETHTMPQWAGSSWYYIRYLDPKNEKQLVSFSKQKYWLPVDIYVGGAEHTVLHLLYARFWHKFLYDLGVVSQPEPFKQLINQGMILGEDGEKMSKSRGNVVSPDEVIKTYGADTLRMYEMFMGPLTFTKSWDTKGINGISRFLSKVWSLVTSSQEKNKIGNNLKNKKNKSGILVKFSQQDISSLKKDLESIRQKVIKQVTEDIERLHFNTAISSLMTYVNKLSELPNNIITKKHWETLVLLLSPFAPFLSEELWQMVLKHNKSVSLESWPTYDKNLITDKYFLLIVQVNGKARDKIKVKIGANKAEVEKLARNSEKVKKYLTQKPQKIIFVPNKLINFVI